MAETLTQPLKWHGGKSYLASKIIALFPPRCKTPGAPKPGDPGWTHYVEPYFGGGAVLLANDPKGISEVANDLNWQLTSFWDVLKDRAMFAEFHRQVRLTPFSEFEYRRAGQTPVGQLETAVRFFIRCRQSMAGRMDSFAPLSRNRTRSGMNEQVSAWLNAIEGLPAVSDRLQQVAILTRPAIEVIRKEDGPRTLFYLDPPYLHETRATTGEYEHEMTAEDHNDLLTQLTRIKGRFLLSGYRSPLYDAIAGNHGWYRHDFQIDNKAAGGKSKRTMTECVWTNYEASND